MKSASFEGHFLLKSPLLLYNGYNIGKFCGQYLCVCGGGGVKTFCFIVAIFDLVHDMEAIFQLL